MDDETPHARQRPFTIAQLELLAQVIFKYFLYSMFPIYSLFTCWQGDVLSPPHSPYNQLYHSKVKNVLIKVYLSAIHDSGLKGIA